MKHTLTRGGFSVLKRLDSTITTQLLFVSVLICSSGADVVIKSNSNAHRASQYAIVKWNKRVVWCGHNLCSGWAEWKFPGPTGTYKASFELEAKGYGSTPWKWIIGGQSKSGNSKQACHCSDCWPLYWQDLGTFTIQNGSIIRWEASNSFACGISGPGSYAAWTQIKFVSTGTGPQCGNGKCESGEDCSNCEQDCGKCGPTCGNGQCESGEDCKNCEQDCGTCDAECGNGKCESGEGCATCPKDCGECPSVDAFSKIEAENYSDQSGTRKVACSEGGENIGHASSGDWIMFKNVEFGSGANTIDARVACGEGSGTVDIVIDNLGGTTLGTVSTSSTGGWQTWQTTSAKLSKVTGKHDLYLKWTGGAVNLNWIQFAMSDNPVDPVCGNGTCENGEDWANCEQDCGKCEAECGNGTCEDGESCGSCPNDCGECETVDAFSTIEAESYSDQSGTQKTSCTEGGENIGYAADGDWLLFRDVDFGDGAGAVVVRVAGETGGALAISIDARDATPLGTVNTPATGGWQDWETVKADIRKTSGTHDLYVVFADNAVNLNWLKFSSGDATPTVEPARVVPGTVALRLDGGTLHISNRKGTPRTSSVHRLSGERVARLRTGAAAMPLNLLLPAYSRGVYVIMVTNPDGSRQSIKIASGARSAGAGADR